MDEHHRNFAGNYGNSPKEFKEKKDLDEFLNKVNEIEAIVKGISSNDEKTVKNSMKRADAYLSKYDLSMDMSNKNNCHNGENCNDEDTSTKINKQKKAINRTVINDKAFKDDNKQPNGMDQDAFMKMMEEDANKRAEDRKMRKEKADELKTKGEKLFSDGRFKEALDVFSEALQTLKDWSTLYTCRAQVHIQLGNFKEALSDCDWAFRADEKSLNAFITQSKVHVAMKDYDKAIEILEKAIEVRPSKKNIIQGYLENVEQCQSS